MTLINFTKMHGLGNDFVILDYEEYKKSGLSADKLAERLCRRNFSVGADGLIIVNPYVKETDTGWIFYNSDGSIAQMCGNGIRCFAKYVYKKGIVNKKIFSVMTEAGVIKPELLGNGQVRVNMGAPVLIPSKIPVKTADNLNFKITALDKTFTANAVSMGNPHCVIFQDADTKAYAAKYGQSIENNPMFPEKTNVEFVKILSRSEINLDVWERGCGITLACGTGACASAAAGILNGLLDEKVKVNLPGGALIIEWNGNENKNAPVFMTGGAEFVFDGRIEV